MDRKLAAGAGLAVTTATATLIAIEARKRHLQVTMDLEKYVAGLRGYLAGAMSDPDRQAEATRINAILVTLGLPDLASGPSATPELTMPQWQLLQLRLQSLRSGAPSKHSLRLLKRFTKRVRLLNLPLAEVALGAAAAVGYAMAHGTPPPSELIGLIKELERRLQASVDGPAPRIGEESLRVLLDTWGEDVQLVANQPLGYYIRDRLQELRRGTLDPDVAPALESRLIDIAGEAGKLGLYH